MRTWDASEADEFASRVHDEMMMILSLAHERVYELEKEVEGLEKRISELEDEKEEEG